ncbi:DUF4145 domain-containing protein [Clostridium perfringens]|nr:DUF4145 domain-containing protein [Clostridium perfringens]
MEINNSYIEPKLNKIRFTCPYCNAIAQQTWDEVIFNSGVDGDSYMHDGPRVMGARELKVTISTCQSCYNPHVWIEENMVIPKVANVPLANSEMPKKVKDIYNEARDVFPVSAKASAALLRLALQYLCIELGEKGKNINTDIGEMVKKGLPVEVQQALDIVRVVGNNAVHPGALNLNDNKEIAIMLFNIVNFIVDNRIVQPKKIEEFYNSLPKGALDGIKSRDK